MDSTLMFEMMQVLFKEIEPMRLKSMMEGLLNNLMLAERERFLGVSPYERSEERQGSSNGYKPRQMKTSGFGSLKLLQPQVRDSATPFRSELFERYQRSEKALSLAVAEMYIKGVSTRKITEIYEKVFGTEISPQFVSNANKRLDEEREIWRNESFEKEFPYIIIDAIYKKVRENSRIVNKGALIVIGIDSDGKRQILDFSIANTEEEASYSELFMKLKERGLRGVKFVISDAHLGLKSAITKFFDGASWQRCRVHFMRNYTKKMSKKKVKKEFNNLMKKVYAQTSLKEALSVAQTVSRYLENNGHPHLAERLLEEIEETLQYFGCVADEENTEPWKVEKITTACRFFSTSNSIERLNGELKRRLDTIRIFPSMNSLERLIGALLIEQDEKWRFETGKYVIFE